MHVKLALGAFPPPAGLGLQEVRIGGVPVGGYEGLQVKARQQVGRDDSSHLELMLRFGWWAHQLHRFPNVQQIMQRFEVSRATAYRWRGALAAAHGIECPPDDSPDGTQGEAA